MINEDLKTDILKGVEGLLDGRLGKHTKEIKELLAEQTVAILSAVDEKIQALDLKFSQKIDSLTTTLDRFLKKMTDMEDEFSVMKSDVNKMKKIIREKLGVEL